MSNKILKIYLAGPWVFSEDPFGVAENLKKICSELGFEGVFPLDGNSLPEGYSQQNLARFVRNKCKEIIKSCDIVLANVTPFLGIDTDSGTAFEMGFAEGKDIPVFPFSNVESTIEDRANALKLVIENKDIGKSLPTAKREGPPLTNEQERVIQAFKDFHASYPEASLLGLSEFQRHTNAMVNFGFQERECICIQSPEGLERVFTGSFKKSLELVRDLINNGELQIK